MVAGVGCVGNGPAPSSVWNVQCVLDCASHAETHHVYDDIAREHAETFSVDGSTAVVFETCITYSMRSAMNFGWFTPHSI
jgi:hypothetical protein